MRAWRPGNTAPVEPAAEGERGDPQYRCCVRELSHSSNALKVIQARSISVESLGMISLAERVEDPSPRRATLPS
jgi:hypothetical protein